MFYKSISDYILERLSISTNLNMEYRDVYAYALEKYISGILNTIIFTAVALLLRIPLETAVFFIFFSPLRKYSGGLHAKSRTQCLILSMIILWFLIKTAEMISYSSIWKVFVSLIILIGVLCVFIFAPVDSEKRRLSVELRKAHRKYARMIITLEGCLLVVGMYFFPFWREYILIAAMALLFEGILLIPYKKYYGGKNYEEREHYEQIVK